MRKLPAKEIPLPAALLSFLEPGSSTSAAPAASDGDKDRTEFVRILPVQLPMLQKITGKPTVLEDLKVWADAFTTAGGMKWTCTFSFDKPSTPEFATTQCKSPEGDEMEVITELSNRRGPYYGRTAHGLHTRRYPDGKSLRFDEITVSLRSKIKWQEVHDAFEHQAGVENLSICCDDINIIRMNVKMLCNKVAVDSP